MKRILSLLLVLCTVFSLVSCQGNIAPQTTTETEETKTLGESTETTPTDKPINYPDVYYKVTWDDINAIPVAKAGMTEDELRNICERFFRMQLSMQWTPNEEIYYVIDTYNRPTTLPVGKVYSGAPYVTGATGNLYIMMQFYDPATGIMDVASVGGSNFPRVIGNQCSFGSFWGWARAINSTKHSYTNTIIAANGCLPVGPYTYDLSTEKWGEKLTTRDVCNLNGTQTMYQSYANLKKADGVVTYNEAGHVRMIVSTHPVYKSDGTIDGDNSYVIYLDQGSSMESVRQPDGSVVSVQGGIDVKESYAKLFRSAYVPFTFAEFNGTNPVEDGQVTIDYSGETASQKQLAAATITANYAISDVTVTLKDEQGKVIFSNNTHPSTINSKTLLLRSAATLNLANLASKGNYTVFVECRLGTGELLTVYSGKLVKN